MQTIIALPSRASSRFSTWSTMSCAITFSPGRDAGEARLEVIKAQLQWSCFGAPRRPQQELQARTGDHIGDGEVGACHPDAAFGISFQPGETEVNLLAHFFRLFSAERWSEEDR